MPYNPFKKPLEEVLYGTFTLADLQELISKKVEEGYFVEYKQELPSRKAISKSIAALANTYGGWFIIGVKEKNNIAVDLVGIPSSPNPADQVRDIVKNNIDPIPRFFTRLVPHDNANTVLLIYIPPEQETPFITKEGVVYRRNHNSSDPVPESSRHAIDSLYERGSTIRSRFNTFVDESENLIERPGTPHLTISLWPQPLGVIDKWTPDQIEEMRIRLKRSTESLSIQVDDKEIVSGNAPFQHIQPTYNSLIMRQRDQDSQLTRGLTLQLYNDGRAQIVIPLEVVLTNVVAEVKSIKSEVLQNYFLLMLYEPEGSIAELRFFQAGKVLGTLSILFATYLDWLGHNRRYVDLKVNMSLLNAKGLRPFVDSSKYYEHITEFGIPIIHSSYINIPADKKGQEIDLGNPEEHIPWATLAGLLTMTLGMPSALLVDSLLSLNERQEDGK